jgi:hypothetical protein
MFAPIRTTAAVAAVAAVAQHPEWCHHRHTHQVTSAQRKSRLMMTTTWPTTWTKCQWDSRLEQVHVHSYWKALS